MKGEDEQEVPLRARAQSMQLAMRALPAVLLATETQGTTKLGDGVGKRNQKVADGGELD